MFYLIQNKKNKNIIVPHRCYNLNNINYFINSNKLDQNDFNLFKSNNDNEYIQCDWKDS